jgi:hypothetical protein
MEGGRGRQRERQREGGKEKGDIREGLMEQ